MRKGGAQFLEDLQGEDDVARDELHPLPAAEVPLFGAVAPRRKSPLALGVRKRRVNQRLRHRAEADPRGLGGRMIQPLTIGFVMTLKAPSSCTSATSGLL